MSTLDTIYIDLADRFLQRFPQTLVGQRTIGREAELPIIKSNGDAADVRQLWPLLLAAHERETPLRVKYDDGTPNLIVELLGDDYSYAIEVGRGTIEINTRPCVHLFEIQQILEQSIQQVVRVASHLGWLALGYGIQPKTPPSLALMTPKQRYQSLYRAMGEEWLWYTVTASDQTQLAIRRSEALALLNYGNLVAPVIIALCANSPVYGGGVSPYCSSREGRHLSIQAQEHRHGIPPRPFTDMVDYVATVSQATHLIRRQDNWVMPGSQPFTTYLNEHGADFEAFLFHEHYLWNSARIRAAYGTIEIRPACQQPWAEHGAVMALNTGLIEAAEAIDAYIRNALGAEYWQQMLDYHRRVIAHGLEAPPPTAHFLTTIVTLAEEGLTRRGFGEESLLWPIYKRLEQRQNPAQRAKRIFLSDGLRGLLSHALIRLGDVERHL
jgi:gamma-glutamylcysteine synthetase